MSALEIIKKVALVIRDQQHCGRNKDGAMRDFPCPFCFWVDAQEETGCCTIARAAVLATLDAIRQATENMADAGERGMHTTPAGVWIRMIDALSRDISSEG